MGNFNILACRTVIAVAYIYIIGITALVALGRYCEGVLLVVLARGIDCSCTVVGAEYIVVRLGCWSIGVRIAGACGCSVVGYGNLYRTSCFSVAVNIRTGYGDCRVGLRIDDCAGCCRTGVGIGNRYAICSTCKVVDCCCRFRSVPRILVVCIGGCAEWLAARWMRGGNTYVAGYARLMVACYIYVKFRTDDYRATVRWICTRAYCSGCLYSVSVGTCYWSCAFAYCKRMRCSVN